MVAVWVPILNFCLAGGRRRMYTFSKSRRTLSAALLPLIGARMNKAFLADNVASGEVAPMLTISAKDWLSWIGSKSKITLTDSTGSPIVVEPRSIKSKQECKTYLRRRDEYRREAGKIPCWEGANLSLHHRLLGRSNKIGDRVITQRIGLIKRWQWHSSRSDNVYAGCQGPIGGIEHPLRICKHEDMVKARAEWWRNVDACILRSDRRYHELLFTITRRMREDLGGEVACCGSFRKDFVDSLPDDNSIISEAEVRSIIKVLKKVSEGTRKILRTAAELQLGLGGINWRQQTITRFFKPNPQVTKHRVRRIWTDHPTPPLTKSVKIKNRLDPILLKKNSNLTVYNVFNVSQVDDTVYWEFKAG
jgi:hypothetical protein